MKYAFIDKTSHCHGVAALCRCLGVSRSGYYDWSTRRPSQRECSNERLLKSIEAIHQQHRGAYGALKTYKHLQAQGISAGKHRVARLRSEAGIEARRKQRFRVSMEHHKTPEAAPDLLNRAFTASAPDKVWVGDMTFIRTRQAGCIWPCCWMCTPGEWWAGRWGTAPTGRCMSLRWRWLWSNVARLQV